MYQHMDRDTFDLSKLGLACIHCFGHIRVDTLEDFQYSLERMYTLPVRLIPDTDCKVHKAKDDKGSHRLKLQDRKKNDISRVTLKCNIITNLIVFYTAKRHFPPFL